jgi:hypothetical protein
MTMFKKALDLFRKSTNKMEGRSLGEEIAHHIRDLGMPRDQAIAAAYSEEGEGKMAKDVTVATGLTHYDQMSVRNNKVVPSAISEMVKRSTRH